LYKFNGHENGVDWKVTMIEDRVLNISALNTITKLESNEDYTCMYPLTFGFDAYDKNSIENLIDKLIEQVS
jgi:hypothetical protein